jgi:CO/xanthine dehydrogenase Mo-binding subunit
METVILNRPGAPFLGVGEDSVGPTPVANANAVYDTVGIRLRDIPFLPNRAKILVGSLQILSLFSFFVLFVNKEFQ